MVNRRGVERRDGVKTWRVAFEAGAFLLETIVNSRSVMVNEWLSELEQSFAFAHARRKDEA